MCSHKEDALRGIPLFFRNTCVLFFALVLLLMLFSSGIDYVCKKTEFADNAFAYLFAALILGLAISATLSLPKAKRRLKALKPDRVFLATTSITSILLFATQALILQQAWFETGWDASVLTDAGNLSSHSAYFSKYPNQLFLSGVFETISSLFSPAFDGDNYFPLVVGSCLCITVSVFLSGIIAKAIAGTSTGYLAYALSLVFVGLSPWMFVPYSDSYGLIGPMLTLFFYTAIKKPWVKWPGILFFSLVGYNIKPTAIFILLAIVFIEVCRIVSIARTHRPFNKRKDANRKLIVGGLTAITASTSIVLALAFCAQMKPSEVQVDPDDAFSAAHFLMMGSNEESKGIYSEKDVSFSSSFKTQRERTDADIKEWQSRIYNMGPGGVMSLFAKKTLTNFNDGSLAWGVEGTFFKSLHGSPGLVRDFYGIPNEANESQQDYLYDDIAHFTWLLILWGCVLSGLNQRPTQEEIAIYLSLFALSIFLMLFEARARYLFLFAPYFCIAAALGWKATASAIASQVRK